MKNLFKNKKIILSVIIVLIIILLFIFIKLLANKKSVYGDRCKDSDSYKISKKEIKKAKEVIKSIDKVDKIDINTKLCTVKIIINLTEDVDLESIKAMSSELIKVFSKKELKYYDFSLYVTSDNKDSETYPINVTKHNTRDAFAW